MAQSSPFRRDLEQLKRLSTDGLKGLAATEMVLSSHSEAEAQLSTINFPLEEGLFGEAIRLLDDWKSQAATLIRGLDAAISSELLAFERLFDRKAEPKSGGSQRRTVSLKRVSPELVATHVLPVLAISKDLDDVVGDLRPEFVRYHRQCEFHLLRFVERRQQTDATIDAVSREVIDLEERLRRHRGSTGSARSAEALAASEEERKTLLREQQSARASEKALAAERETMVRLIDDIENFLGALNNQIGAANVMKAKLATDIEQGIVLLKAAQAQSTSSVVEIPAPLADMISAFDATPLSGLGLSERKQACDVAFARRLDSAFLPVSKPSADEDVAGDAHDENDKPSEIAG